MRVETPSEVLQFGGGLFCCLRGKIAQSRVEYRGSVMMNVQFLRTGCVVSLIAWIGVAEVSFAFDLKAPFELENALTLPRGVRNPRFRMITFGVEDRFNDLGVPNPLAQRLNKTVTWGDLINAQKTDADKASIQGVLADAGSGISDPSLTGSPGSTTGEINTFAQINLPIFAIGITEKFTAAVAVPVIRVDVSAATGFAKTEDGQKFIDAACATNPEKCNEAAERLNNAVNQKLATNGYQPIQSETVSSVGDIRLIGKYRAYSDEKQSLAIRSEVGLPTGTVPNADKAVDVATGDGQWDVGLGLIYDLNFAQDLRWNVFGSYVAQLPDRLDRRLPVALGDTISPTKERLDRDLGDIISTGSALTYTWPRLGMNLGAGYGFQYITPTRYKDGVLASSEIYRFLEAEAPLQALHSATLAAGFSTVEWFKQKEFALPFQANVTWSLPLAGRNVTNNSTLTGELVLFF